MDESERQEYLREVESDSSIIGATLPETIDIGGEEIALDEFLVETRKIDEIPPDAQATIEEAKRVLRDERAQLVDRLKNDQLSHETADALVEKINGLDRALSALENIDCPGFGEVSRNALGEDYKRWLGFLDQVKQ